MITFYIVIHFCSQVFKENYLINSQIFHSLSLDPPIYIQEIMNLECPICCGLLTEELDVQGPTQPPKRSRQTAGPVAGPSPALPELCAPPCGHLFHKKCLVNWIRTGNSKSCPSCRKAITENQLTTVFLPVVNQDVERRSGVDVNMTREGPQVDVDIQVKYLQERDKVEELQRTLNELQQCQRLLK